MSRSIRPPSTPTLDAERLAKRVAELVGNNENHEAIRSKLDELQGGVSKLGEQVARLDQGQLYLQSAFKEAEMHISELRELVGLADDSKLERAAVVASERAAEVTSDKAGEIARAVTEVIAREGRRPILDIDQLRERFWNWRGFRAAVAVVGTVWGFFKLALPASSWVAHVMGVELLTVIRKVLGPIAGD